MSCRITREIHNCIIIIVKNKTRTARSFEAWRCKSSYFFMQLVMAEYFFATLKFAIQLALIFIDSLQQMEIYKKYNFFRCRISTCVSTKSKLYSAWPTRLTAISHFIQFFVDRVFPKLSFHVSETRFVEIRILLLSRTQFKNYKVLIFFSRKDYIFFGFSRQF